MLFAHPVPNTTASTTPFRLDQAYATIFASARRKGSRHKILIISKAFPWSFIIRAPAGSVVTCGTIFEELHKRLQWQIEDAEWAIVAVDKRRKEVIEKAAKSRQAKDRDTRLKRIDWLGDMTMFEGLEIDKEFETKRHLPGSASVTETWVVRFGKR
jgi:hypothetical protein